MPFPVLLLSVSDGEYVAFWIVVIDLASSIVFASRTSWELWSKGPNVSHCGCCPYTYISTHLSLHSVLILSRRDSMEKILVALVLNIVFLETLLSQLVPDW